jgi:hypothetical protein
VENEENRALEEEPFLDGAEEQGRSKLRHVDRSFVRCLHDRRDEERVEAGKGEEEGERR